MNWEKWLNKVLLAGLSGALAGATGYSVSSGNGFDSPEAIVSAGITSLILGGQVALMNWIKNRSR